MVLNLSYTPRKLKLSERNFFAVIETRNRACAVFFFWFRFKEYDIFQLANNPIYLEIFVKLVDCRIKFRENRFTIYFNRKKDLVQNNWIDQVTAKFIPTKKVSLKVFEKTTQFNSW